MPGSEIGDGMGRLGKGGGGTVELEKIVPRIVVLMQGDAS